MIVHKSLKFHFLNSYFKSMASNNLNTCFFLDKHFLRYANCIKLYFLANLPKNSEIKRDLGSSKILDDKSQIFEFKIVQLSVFKLETDEIKLKNNLYYNFQVVYKTYLDL